MDWNNLSVLVTGANGFSGRHLLRKLRSLGASVARLTHHSVTPVDDNLFEGDINNQELLEKIIFETKPNIIFHLAGKIKSDSPQSFYQVNVGGTVTLFEAIRKVKEQTTVIIVSSSAVYQPSGRQELISEVHPLAPLSHYGVSKLTQETIALNYFREHNIPVLICRPFNLVGPGLSPLLSVSAFARQIAEIEKTRNGDLKVGDLQAHRDFLDIRDAVSAYMHVAEHGELGDVYNICSGKGVTIQFCLDILLQESRVKINVTKDPLRQKNAGMNFQIGENKKLVSKTGWYPQIPIEQSLKELLEYWRNYYDAS